MKTCVIMQPTYLPWLGYFDLIKKSDVFVFLDHVQFSKQSWQQRNKIRDKNGEIILTVPIKHSGLKSTMIKDVLLDAPERHLTKHLKSIKTNYAKSKNYDTVIKELEDIYNRKYSFLADLNIDLIKLGCKLLNIEFNFVLSSDLNIVGNKVSALIDICKNLGADNYLSPVGSKVYIDEDNIFQEHNINLEYQNYDHETYQQINYPNFISHLSFIDYLFNN